MRVWKPSCSDTPALDAWDWLVDTISEELASSSDHDGELILSRLDQLAGYHMVKDLAEMMPVEAARRDIVDRLMARAAARRHATERSKGVRRWA
jgi:hypothetical protein